METRTLALSLVAAALLAPPGAGQELMPASEKTKYTDIQIAPRKNEIIAIAQIPAPDQPAGAEFQFVITSLHFFDRKAKAKYEITPAEGAADAQEGGWCDLQSIAFSGDGKRFVAGGECFFAGWRNPERTVWFMRWGTTKFDYPKITQFAPAKQGMRIAYVRFRTYNDITSRMAATREAKVTLWENGLEDDILVETIPGRELPPSIAAALSNDGNFLAYHHSDKKKLTVLDVADAFVMKKKEHATFDLNLPGVVMYRGRPAICFAHDNSALWVLCKEKLYPFDLKAKKAQDPVEFEREPFGMHALADGSYLLLAEIDGKGKSRQTFLNLFNPKTRKMERRVGLGKIVAPVTISPDDQLLAGCGVEGGIYLWDMPALLKKAEKAR